MNFFSYLPEQERLCYREYWPDAIDALAGQFPRIDLSNDDAFAIGTFTEQFRVEHAVGSVEPISDDLLNEIMGYLPDEGALPKLQLGFRSWSMPARAQDKRILRATIQASHIRRAQFIHDCLKEGETVALFLLPSQNPAPWSEFRLFIRDRKIIGVSQYHHQEAYPEIQENREAIKASLIPFSRQLIDALHMDTVVADVFVEQQADDSFKTTLIELNPFIHRTDPCLYSWKNGGDFDGGIRYRKLRYNPYRDTTHAGKSTEPLGLFREEDYRRS